MRLLLACLVAGCLVAAEPLATLSAEQVTAAITFEAGPAGHGTLIGTFTPEAHDPSWHLYDLALAVGGVGIPTRLDLAPDSPATAAGPLIADQVPHATEDASVYPAGPVRLSLPILLPDGPDGGNTEITLHLSWMACSEDQCNRPVQNKALTVRLPTHPRPVATGFDAAQYRTLLAAELAPLRTEIAKLAAVADIPVDGIRFLRPATVADVEAAIVAAHREGRSAILDFTGASCAVCQQMARTVLRDPRAIRAWNQVVAIEIDTDRHAELADWQTSRFKTQSRPLYVRLDANSNEQRWSEVFTPSNAEAMARFLAWSAGGVGADVSGQSGLLAFLLLAIAGGLFTLVMPCTYPMIPFTVTFFAKQAESGRRLLPLAAFYAGGIVACFVGLGVVLAGVLKANPAALSGNPWTNLIFAAMFIALGLSLIGAFLLHLPSSLENALGGGRGGYIGALLMGLTFVVSAFACTAPFAGLVLGSLASQGGSEAWLRAVGGMAVYGTTIGLPFFILALSPGLLRRLPRAGAWMNEFKVVGGLIELAAAFKFLNIADHAWGWGLFHRDVVVAVWATLVAIIGVYILGRLRLPGDTPVTETPPARLLGAIACMAVAIWLIGGVCGNDLGVIESFLAPE